MLTRASIAPTADCKAAESGVIRASRWDRLKKIARSAICLKSEARPRLPVEHPIPVSANVILDISTVLGLTCLRCWFPRERFGVDQFYVKPAF